MSYVAQSIPMPSDYFGVLWALAGIKNALILEHGATGTTFYNAIGFSVMNKQSPKGILFTTGLDEDDVIMGREDKIVKAVKELDDRLKPELISLAATSVTSVIGLDLEGLAMELQPEINARLLTFSGGGFLGDYTVGIREVFNTLAREIAEPAAVKGDRSVNIIGPSIDSFNYPSDLAELTRMLGLLDVRVNTIFTQNASVEQIKRLPAASLNIVTRDLGLEAAQILEDRFGLPYLYRQPIGLRASARFMEEIAEMFGIGQVKGFIARELEQFGYTLSELSTWRHSYERLRAVVSCPYDYALGLTRLIQEEWGMQVRAVVLPFASEGGRKLAPFQELGVENLLAAPDEQTLGNLLKEEAPHVLFGSSNDFRLAPEVPVKIHSALPAYDHLYLHDGAPFMGFKGSLYLTQTLVNQLNGNRKAAPL